MAFIYITGAPGVGKSTIFNELINLGFEAYDLDNKKFGGAHNLISGKRVEIPSAENRQAKWFEEHEWRIYRPAFEELKSEAKNKNVIICGVAEADTEVLDLFDKILYLFVDDKTLRYRLNHRKINDYGKNQFELEEILKRKHQLDSRYSQDAFIKINASGNINDTILEICTHVSV